MIAYLDHITIIGKSRTGTSIAKALPISPNARLSAHISGRLKKYPPIDSNIIIIATKDDEIAAVSQKAIAVASKKLRLIVHLAGSLPSTVLPERAGVARLTLHPIQTFPKPSGHLLRGIFWMASSDSREAIQWAGKFVKGLGGNGVIVLPAEALPLYHAMTVFGSNFITLLFSGIEEMASTLGQDPKRMKAAMRTLAETSLENVLRKPAKAVLSGPISRKDFATIQKHQKALKSLDPRISAIYKAFLDYGVTLGTSKR
jgi:predicted short-subunit dehydrogenase-like oxidoreductase (DUF2520 family)